MNPNQRYLPAVAANLDHLLRAQMAWICVQGFTAAGAPSHLFAKLCFNALFNDYISKCAKVFELGRQAASLWYIQRADEAAFLAALDENSESLDEMRDIAKRLKHLRDRELMHIDETGVLDREKAWQAAAIDPLQLQHVVSIATLALQRIANQNAIHVPKLPRELNGPRARRIALHLYKYAQ